MTGSPQQFESHSDVMRHAVELARRGIGHVEPNPAVGAVLVDADRRLLAEGWHQEFGGPHAEINLLGDFELRFPDANKRSRLLESATLCVTLEPCCHHGKTPPCSQAIIDAGIRRVLIGIRDPSPHVDGGGIRQLREAGIEVVDGLLSTEIGELNDPFLTLVRSGRPWVHAKWAMTLDGKIATRTGESQWISNEDSRSIVHELRGRMDAIVVGNGTVQADDPLLTARPPGPRTATRIVVSSRADVPLDSQLVRTARDVDVIVAHGPDVDAARCRDLEQASVELLRCAGSDGRVDLSALLGELGKRSMTNVLVEGGAELLGSLFEQRLVDEAHVFIAPMIFGGQKAPGPVGGLGIAELTNAARPFRCEVRDVSGDCYCRAMFGGSFQPGVG